MPDLRDFLLELENPAKYRVHRGVPVFKPHERRLPEYAAPDGKKFPEVVIRVTPADLPAIAQASDAGGPQPITEGHRNLDPAFPESLQPRKVGWEWNHRPGAAVLTPGGKPEPCVLADLFYEADLYDEVGPRRYPFRSADYDFQERKLVGLALLVRRPFLDLGLMPYSHASHIVQYAFEGSIMEPDGDKFTPEEEAQYAKVCRYFKKKFPRMAAYMDDPGTTTVPAGGATEQYAAMEKRLAQSECERLLDRVTTVRYDRAKELSVLTGLPEAQRPAHIQYMLDTYQKLPTSTPGVDVARGGTGGGGAFAQPVGPDGTAALTRAQMEAAVQYQQSAGVPYEAARQWAITNVKA